MKHFPIGSDCEDNGEEDISFAIGSASTRFISLQWDNFTYCHGTPHGFGGSHTQNQILTPVLQAATAADIFGPGDQWKKPLQALFREALKKGDWSPPDSEADNVWAQIDAHDVSPARWLFTQDGLQTSFDSYDGGCYACYPGNPVVPWDQLKPLLAKDAVVP